MGKQSARIVYQGKDHKDIYFQGNYHRAMYKGERLMWMKMGGKKYAPIVRRVNGEYGVYIYYPESRSIERLLELEGDRTLLFNGTFLFTNKFEFVSRDAKNFFSYDCQGIEAMEAVKGGCTGYKSGVGYFGFSFNNNGKIEKEIELPIKPLDYENITAVDYFRDYYFLRRPSGHRYTLGIIRKDGHQLPDVTFRGGGTISHYAYVNGVHVIIVAYNNYLYVYKTRDFSSWTYHGTAIKTIIGNDEHDPQFWLSCIYDGEKYLLYTQSRSGFRKDQMLLYETVDFENFVNVPLPAYIKLCGIKEDSISYCITDEEQFWDDPPDADLNFLSNHASFFGPSLINSRSTLIYDNGIRMNPQSIFTGGVYIDNLYLQESENNMIIDFWED